MSSRRSNGEGYVYKRNNTYYIRIRSCSNGKVIGEKTKGGFRTIKEAKEWAKENGIASIRTKKQASTLQDYFNIVCQNYIETLSRGKKVNYMTAWKRLEPLHKRKVDTITASELCELVSSTAQTFCTANDIKALLTRMFKLIGADKLNDKDLPSYIQLPKKEEKEQGTFTEEEIASIYELYEKEHDRIAACIILMIYTSMMPAELFGLKVGMIDLKERVIRGAGKKTKDRKKAEIVFPSFLDEMIKWLIDTAPSERIIEIDYNEKFYPPYYDVLNRAGCRRLTPYACRHTTNTLLAKDATISNATVAKVMRHSERMNERYTHINTNDATLAIEKLAPPKPE